MIPLNPIIPVNTMVIQSKIMNTKEIAKVNIEIKQIRPRRNIIRYAGICINLIIILIRNSSCASRCFARFIIETNIEVAKATAYKASNANKTR